MNKVPKKKSFEAAINELEDIVNKLESGDVDLEDSVSLYERGIVEERKLIE